MKIFNFKKSLTVFVCVNKNGSPSLHMIEPAKDEERGIWVSKMPFCNSVLYPQFATMLEKSNIGWDHEPEPIMVNV